MLAIWSICCPLHFVRMLLYFLHLTVFCWHQWKRSKSEVPIDCFRTQGIAGAVSFFQFQTSISNHLEIFFVIGQYLTDSSFTACCFAFWHFLLTILQSLFLQFPRKSFPNFRPFSVWSDCLPDFCKSSIYPLVSFRMSCTKDLESCAVRSDPFVIDKVFRDIVFSRLSLSYHVDVFRWDQQNTFTRHILSCLSALMMMSHTTLAQGAQFNRLRNHFFGCRTEVGWCPRTWFMGSDCRSSWKHESES